MLQLRNTKEVKTMFIINLIKKAIEFIKGLFGGDNK
ncbi:epsilon family phenol-soluble modulin [Staphylococcus coagulans]|nr:epsilon family phenol-soluble modulin [Staphylococcus coagulans]